MTSSQLREIFFSFFKSKGHKIIPSASLLPENDPSVLFTTAGMQPLVPYLMGKNHPQGQRLANSQKCLRTGDIEEIGNTYHHTFFEMLGNWSIGDIKSADGIGRNGYWKKDSIKWSFEFLTSKSWLGLSQENIATSVFKGDQDAPFDQESFDILLSLGISKERIIKLPKKNNWWGQVLGPCGPNIEFFYWSGQGKTPKKFNYQDKNWIEIWNNVFMEFNRKIKKTDTRGTPINYYFDKLAQKNVDTGMGLERILAVVNDLDDNYQSDLFLPIIEEIEKVSFKKYQNNKKDFRIITDHIKAAVMAISDGVLPLNKDAGYIVRRLIRRAIVKGHQVGITDNFCSKIAKKVFKIYQNIYQIDKNQVLKTLKEEENKFRKTLEQGLKLIERQSKIDGRQLFDLYQTYGLPPEIVIEEAENKKIFIDQKALDYFKKLFYQHQQISRQGSEKKFKGGLADEGKQTIKLHTSAHLMLAALKRVLGPDVEQKGSNITFERLRFDFNYPNKMTDDQIKKVENLVNEKIRKNLPIQMAEMTLKEARKSGASGIFDDRYGEKVKVYSINNFSKEICGGPHIEKTGEIGKFKIVKEQSSSAGIRRIKAIIE